MVIKDRTDIARRNNERYNYVVQRGHTEYCEIARRLDDMYMGAGKQWLDADRQYLEENGRRPIEINEIFDAINTALGHQIANRVDISYRPRGMGADDDLATSLSKVAMQLADNNGYQFVETDVFADGIVQRRGYFEFRLDFDDNLRGEIRLDSLDPMDVIPDPDAKTYDPDGWKDVIITRWWTLDEIEGHYGKAKRRKVEEKLDGLAEEDWGEADLDGVRRARIGGDSDEPVGSLYEFVEKDGEDARATISVRIVDRQHWRTTMTKVAVYPTGDIRIIEDATPAQLQHARAQGAIILNRPMRRVRWTVSTACDVLLHDDWSPFRHFSIIPFFPFFHRGRMVSLVDNLVGPQEMLNKAASQFLHVINTTANSGWIVQAGSLTNMDTDDLETEGAKTGLVLEYSKEYEAPVKITPNTIPSGIDKLITLGSEKIRMVSGISDAMKGNTPASASGVAIQSLQFGSQLSLSVPLDNMARTRRFVGQRFLEMIQAHMTEPQIFRITETGANGEKKSSDLPINWTGENGEMLNNLTIGEYDAVVTTQPSQVTFQNSQFQQAVELRKLLPEFPGDVLVRYSSLADKRDILEQMAEARKNAGANPLDDAKAKLATSQAVNKSIESLYSAIKTAALLRSDPALAAIADILAKSGGFVDADMAPIYPAVEGAPTPAAGDPVNNTNPITPPNPGRGVNAGIEAAGVVS
jgi:hypothetical protein